MSSSERQIRFHAGPHKNKRLLLLQIPFLGSQIAHKYVWKFTGSEI